LLHSFLRYTSLHRTQWRSRQSIERLQWQRFKRLLEIAYRQTAFYGKRFREAGITPDDIRDRSDLSRIPITTRDDLRHPDELIIRGASKEQMHFSMTTGSTGVKTRMYFDRRSWVLGKILLKIRARIACGVRVSDRVALLQLDEAVRKNTSIRKTLLRQCSFTVNQSMSSLIEQLNIYRPTVLYGAPSYLDRLARESGGLPGISRVFTSAEQLTVETRQRIQAAFGAPVFDIYGSTEVKEIAWQCDRRGGYHINSDWVLVEVLESTVGELGRGPIIVTSLYNLGLPIIRYETGDTGQLLNEKCPCGRGFPLMSPTFGRIVDHFVLPSGDIVSPWEIIIPLEHVEGLKQFQVVQEALNRVVVNAVPDAGSEEAVEASILANLPAILPDVEIQVQWHADIEPESTGKYRIVLSRVGGS